MSEAAPASMIRRDRVDRMLDDNERLADEVGRLRQDNERLRVENARLLEERGRVLSALRPHQPWWGPGGSG